MDLTILLIQVAKLNSIYIYIKLSEARCQYRGELMVVHTADEHETNLGTKQVVRTTVIPRVDIVHGFLNNKNLRIIFE